MILQVALSYARINMPLVLRITESWFETGLQG